MRETAPVAELDARFSAPDAVATPWERTWHVIEDAELFWISTVRADGPPHVTPLPAVTRDGVIYFCTGADEQKGVNLERNPHCTLTTGNNTWKVGLDVVIEGTAERVTGQERLQRLADAWATKYDGDWQYEATGDAFRHDAGEALVYEVAPSKVLAFAKGDFAQTRYRWTS
jgi:nitroimidazol reductase NimA-like FMN-containing flavoprotein (pyridoxamine 5'-phosphate oxidase superfamily)